MVFHGCVDKSFHLHPAQLQECDGNEEVPQVPESGTDQAKLLLELQKENRELRVQLARLQQKVLALQAHSLAANSPTPSSVTSLMTPPSTSQPNEKRKARSTFLAGTCFTPESKKKGADQTVKQLQLTVKALEAQIERMKKNHGAELKQKDDCIRELSRKGEKPPGMEGVKRVVTRASLRPKEPSNSELKSPSYRFRSPAPTAKKRSFWDITTANSPSVATLNGRKTRSHVNSEAFAAPSMLLQVWILAPFYSFKERVVLISKSMLGTNPEKLLNSFTNPLLVQRILFY